MSADLAVPVMAGKDQSGGARVGLLLEIRTRLDEVEGNLLIIETSVTDVTDMDIRLKTSAYI